METPQEIQTPKMKDSLAELQNLIPEIDDLILLSLDELARKAEEEVGYTLDDASLLMYGLADEIDALKFENPAEKAALVSRIENMLNSISAMDIPNLDDKTEEQSYATIAGLLSNVKSISDTVHSLQNAQSVEAFSATQGMREVTYTVQPDDRHEKVVTYMHGVETVHITIPDVSTFNRFSKALGERKNGFLKGFDPANLPYSLNAVRNADGQFYLSDGKNTYFGLGYVPFIPGMQLEASREIVATEKTEITAHFKDTKEEQSRRIDQLIVDPFVDRATITYTKNSVDKYKVKYPDFPFKTGDTAYLTKGTNGKFYFANEQKELPPDETYTINQALPRAFIFEGDILEFQKPVDTIDQNEAKSLLANLDKKLEDALDIKGMVRKIEDEFGVHIGYGTQDMATIKQLYKERFGESIGSLSVRDPHTLRANLSYIYSYLEEYGATFVASSGIKTINLFDHFEYVSKSGNFTNPSAEVIRGGIMTIEDISAFDHELLHIAENATNKDGEISNENWIVAENKEVKDLINSFRAGETLVEDNRDQRDSKSATLTDYSLSRHVLKPELARTLLKSGAPSLYALIAGLDSADEVQAEVADFLKNDPDAFTLISEKDENGNYSYPQLRTNCIRILRFYYEKSSGEINKAWWEKITGTTIADDSLFDFVNSK